MEKTVPLIHGQPPVSIHYFLLEYNTQYSLVRQKLTQRYKSG